MTKAKDKEFCDGDTFSLKTINKVMEQVAKSPSYPIVPCPNGYYYAYTPEGTYAVKDGGSVKIKVDNNTQTTLDWLEKSGTTKKMKADWGVLSKADPIPTIAEVMEATNSKQEVRAKKAKPSKKENSQGTINWGVGGPLKDHECEDPNCQITFSATTKQGAITSEKIGDGLEKASGKAIQGITGPTKIGSGVFNVFDNSMIVTKDTPSGGETIKLGKLPDGALVTNVLMSGNQLNVQYTVNGAVNVFVMDLPKDYAAEGLYQDFWQDAWKKQWKKDIEAKDPLMEYVTADHIKKEKKKLKNHFKNKEKAIQKKVVKYVLSGKGLKGDEPIPDSYLTGEQWDVIPKKKTHQDKMYEAEKHLYLESAPWILKEPKPSPTYTIQRLLKNGKYTKGQKVKLPFVAPVDGTWKVCWNGVESANQTLKAGEAFLIHPE